MFICDRDICRGHVLTSWGPVTQAAVTFAGEALTTDTPLRSFILCLHYLFLVVSTPVVYVERERERERERDVHTRTHARTYLFLVEPTRVALVKKVSLFVVTKAALRRIRLLR